ncbi:MAG: choice-of-anchor D domain-containing protein [Myxococcaceae bacterium]
MNGGGGTGGAGGGGSGGGAGSLGCFGIGGGSEANLHADRSSYDFGTWSIGSTSPAATVHVSLGSVIASDFAGARGGEFELADAGCVDEVGFWCPRLLTFHPVLSGAASATFELAGPGVGACVTVHGAGLEPNGLVASPAMLDFVAPAGTTSAAADITVRNGTTSNIDALSVDLTGDDAALFEKVSDGCVGATLAAGSTCSVQVRYAPDAGVAHHFASLAIISNTPGGAVVSLRGVSTLGAALGWVDPHSVNVSVGTLGQLWLTIANIGTERTGTLAPATIEGDDGGVYSNPMELV